MERRSVTVEYGFGLPAVSGDLLLKIADSDIERATGKQIRGGIVDSSTGQAAGRW